MPANYLLRSVFFKQAFLSINKHRAWGSSHAEVTKVDRLRRSYFLGKRGAKTSPTLQNKRVKTNRMHYFANQLLDHNYQNIEIEEGEEEADFEEYVGSFAPPAPPAQSYSAMAPMQSASYSTLSPAARRGPAVGGVMRHREVVVPEQVNFDQACYGEDEDDEEEEEEDGGSSYYEDWYRKRPMKTKQNLLHILATEIIVNTRLHGEITTFRTAFESWNSLLPHQTILHVLEFLGVSSKWTEFFKKFLQAPLKFTDDPTSEPRLRCRGAPGSHTLSDALGEAVLFCFDFAVNQATDGALTYRMYDDFWFWNKDYEKCANAWASIIQFTEVMGVHVSYST